MTAVIKDTSCIYNNNPNECRLATTTRMNVVLYEQ
jgi:hypothetical protein